MNDRIINRYQRNFVQGFILSGVELERFEKEIRKDERNTALQMYRSVADEIRALKEGAQDANAQRISADLDLLVALEDLYAQGCGMPKTCGHEFVCVCPGDKARAAIAKARGTK